MLAHYACIPSHGPLTGKLAVHIRYLALVSSPESKEAARQMWGALVHAGTPCLYLGRCHGALRPSTGCAERQNLAAPLAMACLHIMLHNAYQNVNGFKVKIVSCT